MTMRLCFALSAAALLLFVSLQAGCDSNGDADVQGLAERLEGTWTGSAQDEELDLRVRLQLEAQRERRIGGSGDFSGTATSSGGGIVVEQDFEYERAAATGNVEAGNDGSQQRLRLQVVPREDRANA